MYIHIMRMVISYFKLYAINKQWRSQGGAQGAQAPPSALGLVDIVYRTASSSTPLVTPNRHLLQNNSLEDT